MSLIIRVKNLSPKDEEALVELVESLNLDHTITRIPA